jgi:hypothetical protein
MFGAWIIIDSAGNNQSREVLGLKKTELSPEFLRVATSGCTIYIQTVNAHEIDIVSTRRDVVLCTKMLLYVILYAKPWKWK